MEKSNNKKPKNKQSDIKTTRAKNHHGHIRFREDRGKYEASIKIGSSRPTRYFDDLEKAEKWLLEMRSKLMSEVDVTSAETLVAEYLSLWLTRKKEVVSENTYKLYEIAYKKVLPLLLQNPVTLFKANVRFFKDLDYQLMHNGISSRYRLEVKKILHATFEQAIDDEIITRNPVRYKVEHVYKSPPAYSPEEFKKFILYLAAHYPGYLNIFSILGTKGFRRNECLGITWDHYNPETGVLIIDQQLVRVSRIGYRLDSVKTSSSNRIHVLGKKVRMLLLSQAFLQDQQKKHAGNLWHNDLNLMFTTPLGLPINPDSIYKKLKRIIRKGGFSETTIHGFRHMNAEAMVESNINIKTAQELLGHSGNTNTYLNIYARASLSTKIDAAEKIENLLLPPEIEDYLDNLQRNAADEGNEDEITPE